MPPCRGCVNASCSWPPGCVASRAAAGQETGNAFAEAVRATFEARSCIIAENGHVLGAALEPAPSGTLPGEPDVEAYTVSAPALPSGGRLVATLTLPRPVAPGEIELLELVVAIASGWTQSRPA